MSSTNATPRNGHAPPMPRFTGAFDWKSQVGHVYRIARWEEPGVGTVWHVMVEDRYLGESRLPTVHRAAAVWFRTPQEAKEWIDAASQTPIPCPAPVAPPARSAMYPSEMRYKAAGKMFVLVCTDREVESWWSVWLEGRVLTVDEIGPGAIPTLAGLRDVDEPVPAATFATAHAAQQAIEEYLERLRRPGQAAQLRAAADRVERGELSVLITKIEPRKSTWTATFTEVVKPSEER